jgi:chromosome segregation ATPase
MGLFSRNAISEEATQEILARIEELGEKLAGSDNPQVVASLTERVAKLRKQLSDLEIEKSKVQEDQERREREVLHKVGLERKRSETETELAKREAKLEIQTANLDAERKQFQEQLDFFKEHTQRVEKMQAEMIEQVLKRIPDLTATLELSAGGNSGTATTAKRATARTRA